MQGIWGLPDASLGNSASVYPQARWSPGAPQLTAEPRPSVPSTCVGAGDKVLLVLELTSVTAARALAHANAPPRPIPSPPCQEETRPPSRSDIRLPKRWGESEPRDKNG